MTPDSLHQTTPQRLERIRFVLVEPSHPGNVGAAARAMRVMGLRDLVLVAPRDPGVLRDPEAIARASGAADVLGAARLAATLSEAVADATLVVGVSADPREFGPPPLAPEAIAGQAFAEIDSDDSHRVAMVFGTERTGLSVAQVAHCHVLCSIPGEPQYHSLNLAQAVQVIAYVLRVAAERTGQGDGSPRSAPQRLASQAAIDGLFEHLERALVSIGFLDAAHPKKLMPRLRRLFARTRLEAEEVDLLRGVCKMAELAGRANPPPWMGDSQRAGEDEGPGANPPVPTKEPG